MKLTKPEPNGASQPIPGVRRTLGVATRMVTNAMNGIAIACLVSALAGPPGAAAPTGVPQNGSGGSRASGLAPFTPPLCIRASAVQLEGDWVSGDGLANSTLRFTRRTRGPFDMKLETSVVALDAPLNETAMRTARLEGGAVVLNQPVDDRGERYERLCRWRSALPAPWLWCPRQTCRTSNGRLKPEAAPTSRLRSNVEDVTSGCAPRRVHGDSEQGDEADER
jgi:hypothetical protein